MNAAAYHSGLVIKHSKIALEIENEVTRPLPDNIKLSELKRQKLRIKDRITSTSQI